MSGPTPNVEFVDVYAAASRMEADRLVSLLGDDGIKGHTSETQVAGFPSDSGHRFVISVERPHAPNATALITQAREDGVITEDGSVLS